jgi:hypothetical protein
MTASIKVLEKGQPCKIAADFDMSGSTGLQIAWTAPAGGTDFTVTQATTPAVTAPAVALTNDPGFTPPRSVAASEYFQYITDGTEFDIDGDWTACGKYTDGALELYANTVIFTIRKTCS